MNKRSSATNNPPPKYSRQWLWFIGLYIVSVLAIAGTVFFLRWLLF